jgi:WD40 repeat protein
MPNFSYNIIANTEAKRSSSEDSSLLSPPLLQTYPSPTAPTQENQQSNPIAPKFFYSSIHHQYVQNGRVNDIAYSPDGAFISVGSSSTVTVYNTLSHEIVQEYLMSGQINAIDYSPDGYFVSIGGDDNKVTVYSTSSFSIVHEYLIYAQVNAIKYSPDGNFIAIGGGNKEMTIFDTTSHKVVSTYNNGGRVYAIAFSPDSNFVTVGGFSNKVTVCNMSSWETKELQQCGEVFAIKYSPDGNFIAVGDDGGKVTIYSISSYEIVYQYQISNLVSAVAYSPDGTFIALGGCDKTLTIYNTTSHQIAKEYNLRREIHAIVYSPDGQFISVGGDDKKVTVYNTTFHQSVSQYQFSDTAIYTIALSPDGNNISLGVGDGRIIVCNTRSFKVVKAYQIDGDVVVYAIAYSPDGVYFAVGGDDERITVYDTRSNQIVYQYERTNVVSAVTFSPDGKFITTGGHDEKITVYDTSSHEIEHEQFLTGGKVYAIAYSPNGEFLAVAGGHTITVYNTCSSFEIVYKRLCENVVNTIAYSPDGSFVSIGGSDGIVQFLEVCNDWKLSYAAPIHFPHSVIGISFVNGIDKDIKADYFTIAVANANVLTTMKIHKHTVTPPEVLLRFQDDKIMDLMKDTNNKLSGLTLNNQGTSLVAYVAEKDRTGLLLQLMNATPSHALIPNTKGRPNGIMRFLEDHYLLRQLNAIADGKNVFKRTTSSIQLNEMVEVLQNLANNQVKSSVSKFLNAGEHNYLKGFVFVANIYALESKTSNIPLALQLEPRSSCAENVYSTWHDLERDDKKRVQLKIMRVLLPDLASFKTLKALTRYNDNKAFEALSVRAAIDANWTKWARKKYLLQLYSYIIWLNSFSIFCETTKQSGVLSPEKRIGFEEVMGLFTGIVVLIGLVYFSYLEFLQMKTLTVSYYWAEKWNLWLWTAKVLSIITVLFRFFFFTLISENIQAYFSAFALLFNWVALFHYMRGFEECAWIIKALYHISANMSYFILILFILMFGFSIVFRALYIGSNDIMEDGEVAAFGNIITSLKTTFFAGIAGDFDLEDLKDTYSASLSLLLMIILLAAVAVIALNALITFIGEKFESVLNERDAILKKEKAKVMLDLYCTMGKDERHMIGWENRWTSIIIPSADLLLENQPYALRNVSRATKDDIMKFQRKLKLVKGDIKTMTDETKREINLMKEEITEIKNMVQMIGKAISTQSQD